MMKQTGKITAPPVFNPTEGMKSLITADDRIEELLNQSPVNGILLANKKKKLLIRLRDLELDIFEKTKLFDIAYGSDLTSQIKAKMPNSSNKINKAKNPALSRWIADLMDPFSVLHSFILGNLDVGRKLRSDQKKDSVLALCEAFIAVKEKVDNRICNMIQNQTNPLEKWMVKLSDNQRERVFDHS